MGKVLPKILIDEISKLHNQGFSSMEIFDSVQEEAQKYVTSGAQLARCIGVIGRRKGPKISDQKGIRSKKISSIPLPKKFDIDKYSEIKSKLEEDPTGKQIEKLCQPIVIDILSNYEGFREVQDVNQALGFSNVPFDFFGFKKEEPYLIEFKGSLDHYHGPKETQKRRLKELLEKIKGLRVALLQVRLMKGEYRIFFDEEMELFFDGPQISLAPVEKWIIQQLKTG